VTTDEIHNDQEFYKAVREYTDKIWQWGAHIDEDFSEDPAPDELIRMLEERIAWVKAHKKAVDRYLRKRNGPTWVRVIEGNNSDSAA